MKTIRLLIISAIVLFQPPRQALAQERFDACVMLLENITRISSESRCVDWEWWECGIYPVCCTPVVCNLTPMCVITSLVKQIVAPAGSTYCFDNVSAQDLWDRWVSAQIALGADLMTGGMVTVYHEAVDLLAATGHHLPDNAQELLRQTLPQPYPAAGKFLRTEIAEIKIVPRRHNVFTRRALPAGMAAVTLGPVVILDDWIFDELRDQVKNGSVSAYDLILGNADEAYARALSTMMHELVHVHQFNEVGRDVFEVEYVMANLPGITSGYGHDWYERVAYGYEEFMAEYLGGGYCAQVRPAIAPLIQAYVPEQLPITCRAVRDSDADGVFDSIDNCPSVANGDQRDDDMNGVGDRCDHHAWLPAVLMLLEDPQ